jgi:hypothetical protein
MAGGGGSGGEWEWPVRFEAPPLDPPPNSHLAATGGGPWSVHFSPAGTRIASLPGGPAHDVPAQASSTP